MENFSYTLNNSMAESFFRRWNFLPPKSVIFKEGMKFNFNFIILWTSTTVVDVVENEKF